MDHDIYSDPHLLKLWIHCLLKASHTEREQLVGRQVITLEPGQFVTGRDALAREFNAGATKQNIVSAITLWRWLLMFESLKMLNIKKTTKYSVVTVIKWVEYQNNEHQMNNKRTSNEQPMNTNNNVNNVNKENKKDTSIQQAEKFNLWWNLYNKKIGKAKSEIEFNKLLKKYNYPQIEGGTKRYLDHLANLKAIGNFVPNQKNPLTFLNGKHFLDEYDTATASGTTPAVNTVSAKIIFDED